MPGDPTRKELEGMVDAIIVYRDKVTGLLKALMDVDPTSLSPQTLISMIEVMSADIDVSTEGNRIRDRIENQEEQ